jgi:hypothetical protein
MNNNNNNNDINVRAFSAMTKQMVFLAVGIIMVVAIVGTWIIITIEGIENRQIERARIADKAITERNAEHDRMFEMLEENARQINLINKTT